jgi:hypothetical protein
MPLLRPLLVGLLVVWAGCGVVFMLARLTITWPLHGGAGVVGTPQRGAAETVIIQALLADRPPARDERWLVVFPADANASVLLYIRYQLAHSQYPRRVDVATADVLPSTTSYAGIITAPGLQLAAPWHATAQHNGFTRYTIASS